MTPLRRAFFRAPIGLYRLGLGGLLGRRFLLLQHVGRKTGLPRRTVLEVVGSEEGAPIVVSGFGERSDWLRNTVARPEVRVTWGRRSFDARARVMGIEEAVAVFDDYRRRHPRAARLLGGALGVSALDPAAAAAAMPVVVLERVVSGEG